MKIAIAIPNHNQAKLVSETVDLIMKQDLRPSHIFIMSDGDPMGMLSRDGVRITCINNPEGKGGRCANRNSVVPAFLSSGDDALVFFDGDCSPASSRFLAEYERLLSAHDLVYGVREHTQVDGIRFPASDLLTANMDNLWALKPIDYTDLRVVSGAVGAWQESSDFGERVDLMLTGMIGWSCNFGITRKGLVRLMKFMFDMHGRSQELFDSEAFGHGWGYEDVAMGIDAMYAGLDIWITEDVKVVHRSHERSDGLFDHVRGRHMIMDRYRKLQSDLDGTRRHRVYGAITIGAFILGALTALL